MEEGYTKKGDKHYQIINALDEDGDVFRFQLFDDTSLGLKMMWGSFMIQFVKMWEKPSSHAGAVLQTVHYI